MIIDDFKSKLFEYQKAKDTLRVGVLRFYLSQVKNREIEYRTQKKEMTDEVAFKVLKKEVKNRKEAIELYERIGRNNLLEKEKAELEVYLEFAKLFPFDLNASHPMSGPKEK